MFIIQNFITLIVSLKSRIETILVFTESVHVSNANLLNLH